MDIAVVVDFDGTVTDEEVSRQLLERFARGEWRGLEAGLEEGELSVREAKSLGFAMLEATDSEMRQFVRENARLREGFSEFAAHLRGLGFPLAVASEGLDLYIDEVLRAHGVEGLAVFCNRWERGPDGRGRVAFPRESQECEECGNCKTALVESLKADGNYVVYIGNGCTDLCPSRAANIVFARGALAERLEEEGRPFVLFEDFFDVIQAWDSVVAHSQTR